MNTYFLRCKVSDRPALVALGVSMGVVRVTGTGQVVATNGGAWDEIGMINDPATGLPLMQGSEPLLHTNLRTWTNLRQVAEAMAASNPVIAAALLQVPKYFVSDAQGNSRAPNYPKRLFL